MTIEFQKRLNKYLSDCSVNKEHTGNLDLLRDYFRVNTGGHFETYGINDPTTITADDLIAVTMLSMEIKRTTKSGISPRSALLISQHREELGEHLRLLADSLDKAKSTRNLEDLSKDDAKRILLDESSPAQMLIRQLLDLLSDSERSPNTKWVAVSKLISRKQPSLLPIRDRRVARRLGYGHHPNSAKFLADWWNDWHEALTTENQYRFRTRLKELQSALATSTEVNFTPSLIRIADVLVWSRCDCDQLLEPKSPLDETAQT